MCNSVRRLPPNKANGVTVFKGTTTLLYTRNHETKSTTGLQLRGITVVYEPGRAAQSVGHLTRLRGPGFDTRSSGNIL